MAQTPIDRSAPEERARPSDIYYKRSGKVSREKLTKMVNPMEWLKSLYAALGAKYPIASLIVVVILGMIVGGLVFGSVWRIGAYQYEKDQVKRPKVESPSQNTTYGPESPIMPNNSGSVTITNQPSTSRPSDVNKETKRNEKRSEPSKNP